MRRRWLFLIALLLAGAGDIARSLHARGAARGAASRDASIEKQVEAAGAASGRAIYLSHCARCHGVEGKGDGPAAAALRPRPRNFTNGVFKLKSTAIGEAPGIDDVRGAIAHGMPGTAMPGFHDLLSPAHIDAVAEYVRTFGPHQSWGAAREGPSLPQGEGRADHGRELYATLGCPACHGKEGRGDGAAAGALKDVWSQPSPPRDLTAPWSFRGGSSDEAVYQRIAHGMSGTAMPGYLEAGSPQDLMDVVAYLSSIARRPAWQEGGRLEETANLEPAQRGEYLVRSGMCGMCHTARNDDGSAAPALAGGMKIEAGAHGIFFAANLTADGDSGIGARQVEELALALQTGHTRSARLNYFAMPWIIYGSYSAPDALAIATYLKTVPAVRNFVPPPLRYGFIETVLRKLSYSWPAAVPERVRYHPGNFGSNQPLSAVGAALQRGLLWGQLLILGAGIVLLFRVPARSEAEGRRSSAVLVASLVCAVVFATAALVVYWYPALNALPAKPLVDAYAAAVPPAPQEEGRAERNALLQRGRYLYLTSSCAYCHNANGSGGGKVTGRHLGTLWSANLTSHETGLAGRSDEAVLRAITSGIGSTGRAIDPRAMPWDSFSNLTPQDQHALLAYLRSLPPVNQRMRAPQPTSAQDEGGVTLWIGGAD